MKVLNQMKIFRTILSFLIVLFFLFPIIGAIYSIGSGFNSPLLPANFVFTAFGVSIGLLIHPKLSVKGRKISKVFLFLMPLIFLVGCGYDYYKASQFPKKIRNAEGISYYYFHEDGFWITDTQDLNYLASLWENGKSGIDWGESVWFWFNGGNSCMCGKGEPLQFKGTDDVIRFKHGFIQRNGFVSVYNSNQRQFMNVIQERLEEWRKTQPSEQESPSHIQNLNKL